LHAFNVSVFCPPPYHYVPGYQVAVLAFELLQYQPRSKFGRNVTIAGNMVRIIRASIQMIAIGTILLTILVMGS
jgi:hypothetical protein